MDKKICKHKKGNIDGYKYEFSTIQDKPTSLLISLSGIFNLTSSRTLDQSIRRIMIKSKSFINLTSKELFSNIKTNRTIVDLDYAPACIKTYSYFEFEIDLFFDGTINIKEDEFSDKVLVLLELFQEYLMDNKDFSFKANKIRKTLNLTF